MFSELARRMPASATRRTALLFAAILALQALDAVAGLGVFWSHDIRHQHVPWRAWAAGEWSYGRVPMWSSAVGNGFPLMADAQAGVFYPVNVFLGAIFSPHRAVTVGLLLHQWWAAMGMYGLCRHLGRSVKAGRIAGVGFGLSGLLVSHFTYVGMVQVMSWVPFGIWAVLKVGEQARWTWGLAWAIAVASMGTAGHPQAAAIGFLG